MALASAGPYASLQLDPDRWPHQHLTTQFFTGRMPFLPSNQQRQSTEVNNITFKITKFSNADNILPPPSLCGFNTYSDGFCSAISTFASPSAFYCRNNRYKEMLVFVKCAKSYHAKRIHNNKFLIIRDNKMCQIKQSTTMSRLNWSAYVIRILWTASASSMNLSTTPGCARTCCTFLVPARW